MPNTMKNIVGSFVIVYALIILIVAAWSGFREGYGLEGHEELKEGKTVFEKLSEVNLIKGITDSTTGLQALSKINNPLDLLGALALSASGALQVIGGVVVFPVDLFLAISPYYSNVIPPIIPKMITTIGVLIVGFILLKAKLGGVEI